MGWYETIPFSEERQILKSYPLDIHVLFQIKISGLCCWDIDFSEEGLTSGQPVTRREWRQNLWSLHGRGLVDKRTVKQYGGAWKTTTAYYITPAGNELLKELSLL